MHKNHNDVFRENQGTHAHYYNLLSILFACVTFILTSSDVCCGVRYTFMSASILTAITLLGVISASIVNHVENYNGDHKKSHILMHVICLIIVIMFLSGSLAWLYYDLRECKLCNV